MGVLEGCDKFLKYIFFFFTFVLFLIGVAAFAIGIWAVADKNFVEILNLNIPGIDAHSIKSAAILLIIVGIGILIVGFLGCCGAAKENRCLLTFFFISLLLVFVLMVAGAVMAAKYQSILQDLLDQGLKEMKKDYDSKADFKEGLDNIEQEFQCCMFNANETNHKSCFPKSDATTPAPPATTAAVNGTAAPTTAPAGEAFTANCADAIMKKINLALDMYKVRIVGIGVASAIIVVLGMIVSMALCCKIQRGYGTV